MVRQQQRDIAAETPCTTGEHPPLQFPPISEVPWSIDVLIVDDDIADMWLTVNAVRGDPRVRRVVTTGAPDEILFRMARGDVRPNLILLDVKMPKVDGFKFIDGLREIPAMIRTPVVMLTTSRSAHDVERARHRKVRSYVVKPDTFEELRDRLSGVITQTMEEWR
jgi:CheY-like chemotaxis protein